MEKIIGIDLGTTNSCVSVLEGGQPRVIENAEGERTTPSVVAFKGNMRLVGESAKRQASNNPDTVFSIKSKMGYQNKVRLGGETFSPEEVSAMILSVLKKQAEDYLGQPVRKAVITVPAYFNDAQRQATKDAGRIAGLQVERIINEPTAAALAYGIDKIDSNQTVLVYDLGGGTFDVSILELNDGVFEVRSTAGLNNLGGDNFDERLADYLIKEFKKEHDIDLGLDTIAVSRIREAAEAAKRDLSGMTSTSVSLPFITTKDGTVLHLESSITRKLFEEITKDLIDSTRKPLLQAISDAKLDPIDIDKVILVGGSTRMPAVVQLVKEITGQEPYKGVNPDEVVAMGAAIQGGILTGEVDDLVLVDVAPLSLGIQTAGGLFSKIIERNTPIPISKKELFTTASDNQHTVTVNVLQGERPMAIDNNPIGHLQLSDILPAPAGVPQIEVTFSIDRNGIVSVSAKDQRTGRKQSAVMQTENGLSENEISRMIRTAEKFAAADARKLRDAEIINNVRQTLSEVKKLTLEAGNLDAQIRERIEQVSKELNSMLESEEEVALMVEPLTRLQALRDSITISLYKESLEAK